MKWTNDEIAEAIDERLTFRIAGELLAVRNDVIDECCKAVCVYCRDGTKHRPVESFCGTIRQHFRETT